MRNIFDQYQQPENRVTHALMTAFHQDRVLLERFLHDLLKLKAPVAASKLSVLSQRSPFSSKQLPELEASDERKGIPDGWIYSEEAMWCIFIEVKVTAPFSSNQIKRHRRAAEDQEFQAITAVVIVPTKLNIEIDGTKILEWRNVYAWLSRYRKETPWAEYAAQYLEIVETQLIESGSFKEGTLTMFSGFPFSRNNPYEYHNAKRILKLACSELRRREELINSIGLISDELGSSKIKGAKENQVWDYLTLWQSSRTKSFNNYPHLTLEIGRDNVSAMLTLPDKALTQYRTAIKSINANGFKKVIENILSELAPLSLNKNGAVPWFRGFQRHGSSQYKTDILDGKIEFDLRTVVGSGRIKKQELWLDAAFECVVQKKGNFEFQIGVIFPYKSCPDLDSEKAIDLIVQAWLGCKPMIDLFRK
jgi:hypothetical protein